MVSTAFSLLSCVVVPVPSFFGYLTWTLYPVAGDWICTPCAKGMSLEITNKNPNYGYEFPSDDASDSDLEVQRDVWKKLSIGSRIAVYWVDDDQYYNATISQQYGSSSTFHLDYDDGAEEKLDLSKEEIEEMAMGVL